MDTDLKTFDVHVSFKEQGMTIRRVTLHIIAPDWDAAMQQVAKTLDDDGHGLDCEITLITERRVLSRADVVKVAKKLMADNPGVEVFLRGEKVE
jgi:hypothetical protein